MPKKGYKQTKQHRENISKGQKGRKGSLGFLGKRHTQVWRKAHSQRLKGKKRPELSGNKHPFWKGGTKKVKGYIYRYCPDHPEAVENYIAEHRLVMEKHIGRYLEKWEHIHHINGIKTDNRVNNLKIVIIKKHFGKVRCPYCLKDFLIK